jgi:hypothetical protein
MEGEGKTMVGALVGEGVSVDVGNEAAQAGMNTSTMRRAKRRNEEVAGKLVLLKGENFIIEQSIMGIISIIKGIIVFVGAIHKNNNTFYD